MAGKMSDEDYDDLSELMGSGAGGGSNWNSDTAGRGAGSGGTPTRFRPGYTLGGIPGMPVSPSTVDELLGGIPMGQAMEIGQDMMNRRPSTTGHKEDRAHHPGRRVDRQSFGL